MVQPNAGERKFRSPGENTIIAVMPAATYATTYALPFSIEKA